MMTEESTMEGVSSTAEVSLSFLEEILPVDETPVAVKVIKRRVKKKVHIPEFTIIKANKSQKLVVNTSQFTSRDNISSPGLIMSPFTDFIPYMYLLSYPITREIYDSFYNYISYCDKGRLRKRNFDVDVVDAILKKAENNIIYKCITGFSIASMSTKEGMKPHASGILKQIYEDVSPLELRDVFTRTNAAWSVDILKNAFIPSEEKPHSINMKTWSGYVSNLSLFEGSQVASVPRMLLTIPRENYEDVKVEYLTRGRVDMSKCVMFIDRMLDSTDFPNKSMRGMYIRYFKPYIESLGVNIAKVPAEYILDKCFHTTDIKITEKSIVEKKKKIDEVVEQFLRGVKAPSLPEGAGSFTIENMQQAIGNIYGQHRTPVYNVGIDPSRIGDVHISTPISLDGSQGLESYIQDNPIRIYTSEEVQRIFNEPLESRYNGAEHVQAPEVRVPIRRRPPNPIPPVEPQGWSMEEMERIVEEMRTS